MDDHSIAEQVLMEQQTLKHIREALRVTLNWELARVGLSRKISSVGFTAKSFQRHLERVLSLEEDGGYMEVVRDEMPNWYCKVETLRADHDRFRHQMQRIIKQFHDLATNDEVWFNGLCCELKQLLEDLEEHERHETDLLQDVLLVDVGGENG
jgi:hypothetical protein